MTKAVGLLVEGFSYIGKSICPRFEPLSRTPFLDSRRVLSDRAARVVDSVGRKVYCDVKRSSSTTRTDQRRD